jgi:molecular chaperone DnaJ
VNVVEAHRILDLAPDAGLDELKKSYRKLAFRYHPDLNTGDPLAKRKFQHLNEAYLLLRQVMAEEPPKAARSSRREKTPEPPPADSATRRKARTAYTKANTQDEGKTNYYFRREDVLQDLLKDQFAKQVFEDIYNELRRSAASQPASPRRTTGTTRTLDVRLGKSQWSMDVSGGFMDGLRGMLLKQLDDEQTVHVPPASILPGAKVRVGIKQGISGEQKTVEFTLPKDYTLGQPVRLKGLGRKLGPWRGDLYLRLTLG